MNRIIGFQVGNRRLYVETCENGKAFVAIEDIGNDQDGCGMDEMEIETLADELELIVNHLREKLKGGRTVAIP